MFKAGMGVKFPFEEGDERFGTARREEGTAVLKADGSLVGVI
jgi:hypothetical protein